MNPPPALKRKTDARPRRPEPDCNLKPSLMWRKLLKLGIALGIAALLLVVAVQAILWSDLPRRLAEDAVREQTGLEVEIARMRTGWGGRTRIEDLRVGLPLGDQPLLEVPELTVTHAGLIRLVLTGDLGLAEVRIRRPVVAAQRDPADGTWSLLRAVDIVLQRQADGPPGRAPLDLPDVELTDLKIRIIDAGRESEVNWPRIALTPAGVGAGRWEIDLGDVGNIRGRGLITGDRPHELQLTIRDTRPIMELLDLGEPADVTIEGVWAGRFDQQGLSGRLNLTDLRQGNLRADGNLFAQLIDGRVVVRPEGLNLYLPDDTPVHVSAGSITLQGSTLTLDALLAEHRGVLADLSGRFGLPDLDGVARARWRMLEAGDQDRLRHSGNAALTLGRADQPGMRQVQLTLNSQGQFDQLNWQGAIEAEVLGDGRSPWRWSILSASGNVTDGELALELERIILRGAADEQFLAIDRGEIHLRSGPARPASVPSAGDIAVAHTPLAGGQANQPVEVRLVEPVAPANPDDRSAAGIIRLRGRADRVDPPASGPQADLSVAALQQADLRWQFGADIERLHLPWLHQSLHAATFTASGDLGHAQFDLTRAQLDDQQLAASGRLDFGGPMAVVTRYQLRQSDIEIELDPNQRLTLSDLSASGEVRGTLMPLVLTHTGTAQAAITQHRLTTPGTASGSTPGTVPVRAPGTAPGTSPGPADNHAGRGEMPGAAFASRQVERLQVGINGRLDPEHLTVTVEPFSVLGGQIAQTKISHRLDTGFTEGSFGLEKLQLSKIESWAGLAAGVTGVLSAEINFSMDRLDFGSLGQTPEQLLARIGLRAEGAWALSEVTLGEPLVDRASGRLTADHEQLRISLEEMVQAGAGRASGRIAVSPADLRRITADLDIDGWEVALDVGPALRGQVGGEVRIGVEIGEGGLAGIGLTGGLDVRFDGRLGEEDAVSAVIRGNLEGRTLAITELTGQALGSFWSGRATVNMDDWMSSSLVIDLGQLEGRRLAAVFPMLSGLEGSYAGRLVMERASDARAPGPYRLSIDLQATNGRWRRMDLGSVRAVAFHDGSRLLLDSLEAAIADGTVRAWGRISQRQERTQAFLNARWQRISVPQLADFLLLTQTEGDELPEQVDLTGRAGGSVRVSVPLDDWFAGSGQGSVELSEADLVRLPLISSLYDLMNLRIRGRTPEGQGQVAFRLEGHRLVVSRMNYANRGASIQLAMTVEDLRRAEQSPIRGRAVARINPLPLFPFIQEYVDAIIDSQSDLTTVIIAGTVENQEVRPVTLDTFRQTLRTEPQPVADPAPDP